MNPLRHLQDFTRRPGTALPVLIAATAVVGVAWYLVDHDAGGESEEFVASGAAVAVAGPGPVAEEKQQVREAAASRHGGREISPPEEIESLYEEFVSFDGERDERSRLLLDLARSWGAANLEEGLGWAFGLPEGEARLAVREILLYSGHGRHADALALIDDLENVPDRLRQFSLTLLLDDWAREDPAAAWRSVGSVDDPAIREAVESGILSQWAHADSDAAADFVDGVVAMGGEAGTLAPGIREISKEMAAQDPTGAIRWAMSQSEGAPRDGAVQGLVEGWMRHDPEAASAWLRGYAEGSARDAGISALVHSFRNEDSQSAYLWAREISDPGHRAALLAQTATFWLADEPERARVAIRNEDFLTPDVKQLILEQDGSE